MNRLLGPIVIVVVVAAGIWFVARPKKEVVGSGAAATTATAPALKTTPIGQVTAELVGQDVQIEGTITQECPTGCWAIVKDDTGEIRIDTQAGGFTLPLKREGSRIKVQGLVETNEAGNVEISANNAEL